MGRGIELALCNNKKKDDSRMHIGKGLDKIFNRFIITIALILIQMGWIAVQILKLANYGTWVYVILMLASLSMSLFVIWRDDNPAYKVGWILIICLLPILGGTMYLFFGNKRPSRSLKKKIEPEAKRHWSKLAQKSDISKIKKIRTQKTMEYVSQVCHYPAWDNTKSTYYPSGESVFPDILEDLRKAEKFIFIEFFIIGEGEMWQQISEVLKEKANAGLDVRVMYDDVGSIQVLPKHFAADLTDAGIEVHAFNPLRPFASLIYNNRDHRKIIVIDGDIGYSGGFNIADEYINRKERFGYWKDTGIRLEGSAVWNFTVMFLNMWNAFKRTDLNYDEFQPSALRNAFECQKGLENQEIQGEWEGMVQPYSDTPLNDENLGENVYLEIINQAESYVYIYTPYLVIDNEMKTALSLAAKRGVDVRIVTPAIPDKKIIFRLTRSYYEPLLKVGVRIFEFTPGFIHAKGFISDDKIGIVGTINMDFRSLYLHFECGTLLAECPCLKDMKEDYMKTFGLSKEIQHSDCKRNFFGLFIDSILRVLSPLM